MEWNDGIFEGGIELFVEDVDDVNRMWEKVKKLEEMKKVRGIEKFDERIRD